MLFNVNSINLIVAVQGFSADVELACLLVLLLFLLLLLSNYDLWCTLPSARCIIIVQSGRCILECEWSQPYIIDSLWSYFAQSLYLRILHSVGILVWFLFPLSELNVVVVVVLLHFLCSARPKHFPFPLSFCMRWCVSISAPLFSAVDWVEHTLYMPQRL